MSGAVPSARVETSYISTPEVLEREAQALLHWTRSAPGFWRPFVVRRLLVLALFLASTAVLALTGPFSVGTVVVMTGVLLVVVAGLTVLDVTTARRRHLEELRVRVHLECPAGTEVRAVYTPGEVRFAWGGRTAAVDLSTVTRVHRGDGVLLLDTGNPWGPWVLPDEMLGSAAMAVLRDALGDRLG